METELIQVVDQQVNIRLALQSDLKAMEWEGEYKHFRNLYADAFQRMQRHASLIWVAEIASKGLIGQLLLQLTSDRSELANGNDRAYLYGFRVRPAYRNLGIGTRMMLKVEDDLRERSYSWLTLNVAINNPLARNLYTRLGFVVVAHEPGIWSYVDDTGRRQWVEEPAWRMEKHL
jgi:ribosomal protein S18 acetylase RimI-like enzyme